LTKRGAAARKFFEDKLSVTAVELKPGDLVRGTNVTMGGQVYTAWEVVVAVGKVEAVHGSYTRTVNGVTETVPTVSDFAVTTRCKGLECVRHCSPESVFRKGFDRDRKTMVLEMALDYQDTLTKAGTVRKRK